MGGALDFPGALHLGARALRVARRDGVRATAQRLSEAARTYAALEEQHLWHELDLTELASPPPMPEGVTLLRAGPGEAHLLALLDGLDGAFAGDAARERLAEGAEVWIAVRDQTPLFSCWVFPRRAPTIAARGGWLELAPDMASLEDSVTSPLARGQGIAPAVWLRVAADLRDRGYRSWITKTAASNQPVHRALAKSGFRTVAAMRLVRHGPVRTVSVAPGEGTGALLAAALDTRTRP